MDGLPSDPSDQNGNNGSSKIAVPPPFGTHFNSHPLETTNTPNPSQISDSSNSVVDPIQSELAQHQPRDEHGRFIPSEHEANPTSQTPSNTSIPPHPSSFLPPIIEVNKNTEPSDKKDPPLFGFFLTNPVTYFKAFLNRLIKRQAITLKIPVLAIIVIMVGIGGFSIGFQSGLNWALFRLFPNYSPILHRAITEQGIIQKSSNGYFLQANGKDKTIWTLQSVSANVKLEDYVNQSVQIKGNLTSTPNLIEVLEVISFKQL